MPWNLCQQSIHDPVRHPNVITYNVTKITSGSLSRQNLTEIPPVESQWKLSITLLLHSHFKINIYIFNSISIPTKTKRRIMISILFLVEAVIFVIMYEGEGDKH